MLRDHIIPKPPTIGSYSAHQLVEQLTDGARPLFADLGDKLVVRSDIDLTGQGTAVPKVSDGDVLGFELIASCGVKTKGRHRYFPPKDWRARRAWLERKALDAGFEICAVTVRQRSEKIDKGGKYITLDRSSFSGVLKVTDAEMFQRTLAEGLSGPAKAFGRGMVRVVT